MRFLLVLLAALGLLASPVSAAAAQLACSQAMSSDSAPGSDMSGMAGMQQDVLKHSSNRPCCNHNGKGADAAQSCAQLCAATCAVDVPLSDPLVSVPFVMTAADHALELVASVHPFEPAGAERPPRSIA